MTPPERCPPQSGDPPGRTRLAALPGALRDPLRPAGGDGRRHRPAAADGACCGTEGATLTRETEARRHHPPQPLDRRARSAPRQLPAVTAPPDADSYSGPRRGPPRVPGAAESGSEGRRSSGRAGNSSQAVSGRSGVAERNPYPLPPVATRPRGRAVNYLPSGGSLSFSSLSTAALSVPRRSFTAELPAAAVSPRGSSSRGSLPRR